MNLLLIVHDGEKLRAFHETATTITDNERSILRGIATDLVKRANTLTNGHDSKKPPVGVLPDGSSMWREPVQSPVGFPMPEFKGTPEDPGEVVKIMADANPHRVEAARSLGYTGEVCPSCHGLKMMRTGTCVTCQDCGNNAGCG